MTNRLLTNAVTLQTGRAGRQGRAKRRRTNPVLASGWWQRVTWGVALSLLLTGGTFAREAMPDLPGSIGFRPFSLIYEPSGVQQIADGRFVVVQDEAAYSLDLFGLGSDGTVSEKPLYRAASRSRDVADKSLRKLEDLEGVGVDRRGYIFAITSHSRNERGKRKADREQLIRFRLQGERVVDVRRVLNLRNYITKQHQFLKTAAKERAVKEDGGLNIEAIAFDAEKQKLLLGLRSPVVNKEAVIVTLENPHAVFEHDEQPRIADDVIRLDLDGGGIRALSYDPHLGGYLIVSRKPGKAFKLWLWRGEADAKPQRIRSADIKDLRQAEGITPVRLNDEALGILIVSDDGDETKRKPGHYLFLSYEQIVIGRKIKKRKD